MQVDYSSLVLHFQAWAGVIAGVVGLGSSLAAEEAPQPWCKI